LAAKEIPDHGFAVSGMTRPKGGRAQSTSASYSSSAATRYAPIRAASGIAGADGHLGKPIQADLLLSALAQAAGAE